MTFVRDATAKFYLVLSVIVIFSVSVFVTVNYNIATKGQNPWNKPTQNISKKIQNGPGLLWCERRRPMDFMAEPSNSMSNFAYILFGLIMFHYGIYDQHYNTEPNKDKLSLVIQYPAFSMAFGFSSTLLGICSFLFHAANMSPYGHWDVMSMYSCTLYPIWYILFQYLHWIPFSGHVLLCFHFGLLYYLFLFGVPYSDQFVMISIVLMLLVSVIITYFVLRSTRVMQPSIVFGAFISVIVGYGLWNLEKVPGWCNPDAILQFHAIWHCLTGLSLFLAYMYVRVEVARENSNVTESGNEIDIFIEKIEAICAKFDDKENPQ